MGLYNIWNLGFPSVESKQHWTDDIIVLRSLLTYTSIYDNSFPWALNHIYIYIYSSVNADRPKFNISVHFIEREFIFNFFLGVKMCGKRACVPCNPLCWILHNFRKVVNYDMAPIFWHKTTPSKLSNEHVTFCCCCWRPNFRSVTRTCLLNALFVL